MNKWLCGDCAHKLLGDKFEELTAGRLSARMCDLCGTLCQVSDRMHHVNVPDALWRKHAPNECPGTGQKAILDMASGFYGCSICKVPQGVILRPGFAYLTPSHNFGEMHREPGDVTYVLRLEHQNEPILIQCAKNALPKDMVIDLLVQGLMRARFLIQQAQERKTEQPSIILTGIGGQS